MTLEELLEYILEESKYLKNKYGVTDPVTQSLGRIAKLTEEVGELSSEVLAYHKLQGQRKLAKHTRETLADEVADVLICTLLLADSCDVDIKKALREKIARIRERRAAYQQAENQ